MKIRKHLFPPITKTLIVLASVIVSLNAQAQNNYYRNSNPYPPQQQIRTYDYVYYPSHQVYFSPKSRMWFWSDGANWRSNHVLPYGFNLDIRFAGIPITLRSHLPYYEHAYVDNYYGRPRRSSHNEGSRYRKDREWHEQHRRHHW